MATGELQFAAFLSYSRKDGRLARWLVRSLEEFRLPRQTVDDLKARRAPFIAARPIFRDIHDMPVGGVISERLTEVLDASATMIVLCTAASAKSDWVNREIQLFASRHPDRRIIAAIAEGEPETDECYPPALLAPGKPLAADLRRPGERRQAAVKIAAAVLGLDVDQLVGRVKKHRAEQMRWLAVGGGAAVGVVIGLGVTAGAMANSARQADDVARGQIERLLNNTRDAVDKLAAKAEVHAVAKPYFDRKAGRKLNDKDLLLKAEWLRQQGEDAGKRGEDEPALAYRQEAYAASAELLKRDPDNPEFLFSHSQSAYWVGQYYFERGETDAARPPLETYRTTAERLLALAPDYANAALQTDARSEAYYANVNIGVLSLEKERDPRAAAAAFSGALKTLDANPDGFAAKLNLSRSHLQYIDALAQFAPAVDVMEAVRSWEPLLFDLESHRNESDDVDFHLANSWGVVFRFEEHLPPDFLQQSSLAASRKELQQKPNQDPDNLSSLSLAAEIDLKEEAPDCSSLPPPSGMDITSKPQLGLVGECLAGRPADEQFVRCAAFADALAGQRALLDVESSWASLLAACSRAAGKKSNAILASRLEGAASELFFVHQPEEMRLRTQFALADFDTHQAHEWVANLNASLDRRGWVSKGKN